LQHYLKTYEYGCASSHHLWESFESVSHQPISAMMKSWIEQPGFPIITVNRRGNELALTQQRFTYLPNNSDQKWLVPLTISLFSKTGATRQLTLILDDIERAIDIDEDIVAYKINERQTGFYRVKYGDQKNIDELGQRVRKKSMSPEDRWGLQNDLYALVKSGEAPLDEYLKFLSFYDREDAYLPLASMAENLYSAYLVIDADHRQKITSLAVPKFEDILANIGYEPAQDEDHPTSLLRDQIIWDAALYGSRSTLDFIHNQFAALMNGDAVHPDIMKSVMQAGALSGNEQVFDWFDQRLRASQIEHERMNILTAIGCFKDEGLILKTQQYILDTVPARNKFIPVVALCSNPHAIALMWDWYVSNLAQIEQFHPMLYERVVAAIVPTAGLQRADEVKAFFDDYRTKKDTAKDVINLSLERLEINLRMRNIS
jgi:aminopeptidase N